MFKELNLSYAEWKLQRTFQTGITFYVEEEFRYIPFVVDKTGQITFRTEVMKDDPTNADLIDFETNIKGSATAKDSIADGISEEIR